jgi:hypothetical protein
MNTDLKKVLLIFGGGLLVFLAFKKIRPIGVIDKKKGKNKVDSKSDKVFSDEDKKNAAVMMKAYSDARAAGEKKEFLNEMNREFISKYSMKVYVDRGTSKLFVADNEGNKVK